MKKKVKAGGLCKLLRNTGLFSSLNIINVVLSNSLELYIWVWAVFFHIESLTELCATATALWLLHQNGVFQRQPTRGKLQELSMGETSEGGGREACVRLSPEFPL